MQYVEYNFYVETYLGKKVSEDDFDTLATRASEKLNMLTFGRIVEVDDNIRLAVCAMTDVLASVGEVGDKEIASESNDGYSVSFTTASPADRERITKGQLYDAAYTYLYNTGLMDWSIDDH